MQSISTLLDAIYALPAAAYYSVQKLHAQAYRFGFLEGVRAPIPIVSVGNIAMGGTGKTPFTTFLAELAQRHGRKPAILSRGYGGSNRAPFLVVADGQSAEPLAQAAMTGDEPWLMASRLKDIPVIVGQRRIHPARAAAELFGCDMAVLDDGFQHMQLHRDLDIVLLDGSEDRMFPLGKLREPISALQRADIICFSGSVLPVFRQLEGKPIFRYRVEASGVLVGSLPGTLGAPEIFSSVDVVLVSGIANPHRFRLTAAGLGWKVNQHVIFPDHHPYSDRELDDLRSNARGRTMVFTEKDWVKLPKWFVEAPDVAALRVSISMEDQEGFWLRVSRSLSVRRNGQ
jgi:tetraacyldisaccharide 4'-kinase